MLPFSVVLDPDKLAPERIRPLRRAEYDRMVELGLFEDERVELLGGHLVEMSPQGDLHAFVVAELGQRLGAALLGRARVRQHSPLAVSDHSEPEPDVAVVPDSGYTGAHPAWAHLVVEVSDFSLRKDRELKSVLYAVAAIPEYWVVNLLEGQLEVFTEPSVEGYKTQRVFGRDGEVTPGAFPDVALRIGEFLPG